MLLIYCCLYDAVNVVLLLMLLIAFQAGRFVFTCSLPSQFPYKPYLPLSSFFDCVLLLMVVFVANVDIDIYFDVHWVVIADLFWCC